MAKSSGSKNRNRSRGGGKRPQGRIGNYDSGNGRNRGNAQQLMDKFLGLARDASSQGDRILAENYYQHADHYYRVLNARNEQMEAQRRRQSQGGGDPLPVQSVEAEAPEQGPVDLLTQSESSAEGKSTEVEAQAPPRKGRAPGNGSAAAAKAPEDAGDEAAAPKPKKAAPRTRRKTAKATDEAAAAG